MSLKIGQSWRAEGGEGAVLRSPCRRKGSSGAWVVALLDRALWGLTQLSTTLPLSFSKR